MRDSWYDFLISECYDYLDLAKHIRVHFDGDPAKLRKAAFNMSMSGEFLLKALLYEKTGDKPEVHNHMRLANLCGAAGVKLPKKFRAYLDDLVEFEANTRYKETYTTSNKVFDEVYEVLEDTLLRIDNNSKYNRLLKELPAAVVENWEGTPAQLVKAYGDCLM